jgi:ABC-type uncharacterized transport system involved in gliding motility auxiliary subunit
VTSLTLAWASPLEISGAAQKIFWTSTSASVDKDATDLSPLTKKESVGQKQQSILAAMNTEGIKVFVAGNSEMVEDSFVVNNQQNLLFALNLVDYFSQDKSLLGIRTKILKNTPLNTVSDTTKEVVKVINVIAPIFLTATIFVGFNIVRKKKNEKAY